MLMGILEFRFGDKMFNHKRFSFVEKRQKSIISIRQCGLEMNGSGGILKQRLHGGKDKCQSCPPPTPPEVQYVIWLNKQFANIAIKSMQRVYGANTNTVESHCKQRKRKMCRISPEISACHLSDMVVSTWKPVTFWCMSLVAEVSSAKQLLSGTFPQPDLINQEKPQCDIQPGTSWRALCYRIPHILWKSLWKSIYKN